jgi:hypothetical protein
MKRSQRAQDGGDGNSIAGDTPQVSVVSKEEEAESAMSEKLSEKS